MLAEVRKSINSILFERVTSPFYGTFLFAWSVWNWRIIYLTLFVSEERIDTNKLSYINDNYVNLTDMLWIPLGYSIILLTIGSIVSNYVYWFSLFMKQWKIKKRNSVEGNQMLTVEKSVQLRTQVQKQQLEFATVIDEKDQQIRLLSQQIEGLTQKISSAVKPQYNQYATSTVGTKDLEDFQKYGRAYKAFMHVVSSLEENQKLPKTLEEDIIDYFILNYIVEEIPGETGRYRLSHKGAWFHKEIFNQNFAKREEYMRSKAAEKKAKSSLKR